MVRTKLVVVVFMASIALSANGAARVASRVAMGHGFKMIGASLGGLGMSAFVQFGSEGYLDRMNARSEQQRIALLRLQTKNELARRPAYPVSSETIAESTR
ncbi:MAG TPA: hypothetical protein VLG71_03610 [Candidatus Limnocylindria bacterium]|nr:hypothetical protein [Candidatus Limnocylindria bacterium]